MAVIRTADGFQEGSVVPRGGFAPCWPPALCPACAEPMAQSKGPFPAENSPFELRKCGKCGLVLGRPTVDAYDSEEYEYYSSLQGLPRDRILDPLNRSRYLQLLRTFTRLTSGRRLLDVGCGRGGFVDAASSAGWAAEGIELSAAAVGLARSLELPVSLKDFFDPSLLSGWNVIVMTEVIEHLSRPGDFVSRAGELLANGGLLYLTTPNWGSLERRLLGPQWDVIHREHLSYFSESSIRRLIAQHSNLRILSVRSENIGLAKLWALSSRRGSHEVSCRETSAIARARDQEIRKRVYASPGLRACKQTLNELINYTGLGSTLKVTCQKP